MRDPGLGSSDVWEMEEKVEMEMEKVEKMGSGGQAVLGQGLFQTGKMAGIF